MEPFLRLVSHIAEKSTLEYPPQFPILLTNMKISSILHDETRCIGNGILTAALQYEDIQSCSRAVFSYACSEIKSLFL